MTDIDVLHSSERMDWRTPDSILVRVRGLGTIGLDPCASANSKHHFAAYNLTEEDDGLEHQWDAYSGALVYVNPPYGRGLPVWVDTCNDFGEEGTEIVLLVPSRTDTRWFRSATEAADARCLLYGRLTFQGADNSAPFPSAVFYYGDDPWLFCSIFREIGEVQVLR